jgi:porin
VFSYTGEFVGDAAGGVRRGAAFTGTGAVEVTFRLGQLVGWRGAQLFVLVQGTHGGAPSDLVGDVQGVSNLEAPPALRLEEIWLQQNLFANRLSWLVGRYDLSTEFYRLQSGGLFVNSSFGTGPEFALSGVEGPSIYPNTSVGARVEFKPSPNVVWRAAALDGAPVNRPGGGIRLFAPADGALLVGEMAVLSRPDPAGQPRNRRLLIGRGLNRSYSGKLALGGWTYTARFPDLSDTVTTGVTVQRRASRGAYLIADQTVWSAGPGSPAALAVFAQLGVADGRVNRIGGYMGGGLTFTGPLSSRPQDALGLAVAVTRNGSHFRRAGAGLPAIGEVAVELTYVAQFGTWLALQPNLQYIIDPGGVQLNRNAVVPGIRIALSR